MKKTITACFFLILALGAPTAVPARLMAQRTVLENGLVLLTSEQRSLPIVTFHLLLKAGSRYDPRGREGLANLTSRLLTYGTSKRSALQISEEIDFIGARLRTRCRRDLATLSLTLLKKDLDGGLDLFADLLTNTNFPSKEIDRRKRSVLASIKAKRENPRNLARERFREALFPNSPYGRPVEGTEQSVKAIDRSDLVKFYREFYRPNGSILAVVGDVSQEEIKNRLNLSLRQWKKAPVSKDPPVPKASASANMIRVHKDLTQANIMMGHGGVPRGHPDFYAIRVMNYILGAGGLSSRLADAIRNERGLAYSVRSVFSESKNLGTFQVSMQTKNETAQEAIGIAIQEIERIREQGVKEDELRDAKDYLIGSFPLRLDTNRRVARFLARVEYLQLGLDYMDRHSELIRRVRGQDILRVARTYLHPEKLTIVIVANLKKAK